MIISPYLLHIIYKQIISTIMLKRLNRNVDYTSKQILRFFWASQMVFLLPMIIASLSLINSVSSPCLAINFNGDDKVYFGIFFLGQWVSTDAYIKLAILVALLFIVRLSDQLNCDKTLVVIAGVLLRFYYIFAFGWTIAVSVLFWGHNSNLPRPTYVYCEGSPYQGYLFFLLIYTYIIIPINLVICGFRSGKQATSEMPSISTDRSRGQTELMQKNV